jgi:hypothetical protein
VDAYTSYILKASHARLDELRREAAEHAMSRAARRGRTRWWTGSAIWRRARPQPVVVPAPVRCPVCQTPLALTVDALVSSSA